jgi:hypothetical protein
LLQLPWLFCDNSNQPFTVGEKGNYFGEQQLKERFEGQFWGVSAGYLN